MNYFAIPGLRRDIKIPEKKCPLFNLTIDDFFNVVCAQFEVSKQQVLSRTRKHPIVFARHAMVYLVMKYIPGAKTVNTGQIIGNYIDHSSVIHANRAAQNLIETEQEFNMRFAEMERALIELDSRKKIAA